VEPELPKAVANAFNTEAMKLGVQGVSIFQARKNPKKCGYNPSFPYVTTVGATQGPESCVEEVLLYWWWILCYLFCSSRYSRSSFVSGLLWIVVAWYATYCGFTE